MVVTSCSWPELPNAASLLSTSQVANLVPLKNSHPANPVLILSCGSLKVAVASQQVRLCSGTRGFDTPLVGWPELTGHAAPVQTCFTLPSASLPWESGVCWVDAECASSVPESLWGCTQSREKLAFAGL